jgi:glycosyltransferase involved in cell wall biosynthesis
VSTDSQLAAETPQAGAATTVLKHDRPEDKELPALSVVVPVRNDPANLERCLAALETSDHPEFEVIVVDDASTDETPAAARRFGARLLHQKRRTGPAAARNRGAKAARHPFLFFLDADVAVRPETLSRVAERFLRQPETDAFFGSYDVRPSAPNLVSQFRNLVHHYVHQSGNEEASTFWSGCGAMKRSLFLEVGGFDTSYLGDRDAELNRPARTSPHQQQIVGSVELAKEAPDVEIVALEVAVVPEAERRQVVGGLVGLQKWGQPGLGQGQRQEQQEECQADQH